MNAGKRLIYFHNLFGVLDVYVSIIKRLAKNYCIVWFWLTIGLIGEGLYAIFP